MNCFIVAMLALASFSHALDHYPTFHRVDCLDKNVGISVTVSEGGGGSIELNKRTVAILRGAHMIGGEYDRSYNNEGVEFEVVMSTSGEVLTQSRFGGAPQPFCKGKIKTIKGNLGSRD